MIIAGTVSAYLTLSIEDFKNNLLAAMQMLGQFGAAGLQGSSGLFQIESAAGQAAGAVSGQLMSTLGAAGAGMTGFAQQTEGLSAALEKMSGTAASAAVLTGASMTSAGAAAQQMSMQMTGALGAASAATSTASYGISSAMQSVSASTVTSMAASVAGVASFAAAQPLAVSIANGIRSGIQAPIDSLKGSLTASMVAAGAGMASGLSSKAASIYSVARNIANTVRATIENALQIASPSKVMRRVGAYTVEGLALGMEELIPRVASTADAVARTVEQHAAASVVMPGAVQSAGEYSAAVMSRVPAASVPTESQADFAAIGERLDRLLDYFAGTEPVLRLDGRTVGRMIREYTY